MVSSMLDLPALTLVIHRYPATSSLPAPSEASFQCLPAFAFVRECGTPEGPLKPHGDDTILLSPESPSFRGLPWGTGVQTGAGHLGRGLAEGPRQIQVILARLQARMEEQRLQTSLQAERDAPVDVQAIHRKGFGMRAHTMRLLWEAGPLKGQKPSFSNCDISKTTDCCCLCQVSLWKVT
jgi:hypothetical protein